MGFVVKFVRYVLIQLGLRWLWEEVVNPALEAVFGILGVTSEDVTEVAVATSRLTSDTTQDILFTRFLIKKIKHNRSPLSLMISYADNGTTKFSNYYYNGKRKYNNKYKLTSIVLTNGIATSSVQQIIEAYEKNPVEVIKVEYNLLNTTLYVKYMLQQQYNFNIETNTVKINGKTWIFEKAVFNTNPVGEEAHLNRIDIISTTNYYEITTIIIRSLDNQYDYCDTIIQSREETTIINTGLITNTYTDVSNVTTIVLKDSVKAGTTEKFKATTNNSTIVETKVISFEPFKPNYHYITEYRVINTKRLKLWLYDVTLNIYDNLKGEVEGQADFDMLPSICIKENGVFITDENFVDPNGDKKVRLKETDHMLKYLGLATKDVIDMIEQNPENGNIKNVFVMFGLSIADLDPIISKVLYISFKELFDLNASFYQNAPDSNIEGKERFASVGFQQEPFNLTATWSARPIRIRIGKITEVGRYKHELINADIIQETWNEYHNEGNNPDNESYGEGKCLRSVYSTTKLIDPDTGHIFSTKTVFMYREGWYGTPFPEGSTGGDADNGYTPTVCTTNVVKVLIKRTITQRPNLVIYRQLTENTYELLRLDTFTAISMIKHTHDGKQFLDIKKFELTIDEDMKNFILPLSFYVLKRLNHKEKAIIFNKSLHLWIEAGTYKHLEWYESSSFANFLFAITMIISLLITVVTLGAGSGLSVALSTTMIVLMTISTALSLALKICLAVITDEETRMIVSAVLGSAALITGAFAGGAGALNIFTTGVELVNTSVEMATFFIQKDTKNIHEKREEQTETYNEKISETNKILERYIEKERWGKFLSSLPFNEAIPIRELTLSDYIEASLNIYLNYDLIYNQYYDRDITEFYTNKLSLRGI